VFKSRLLGTPRLPLRTVDEQSGSYGTEQTFNDAGPKSAYGKLTRSSGNIAKQTGPKNIIFSARGLGVGLRDSFRSSDCLVGKQSGANPSGDRTGSITPPSCPRIATRSPFGQPGKPDQSLFSPNTIPFSGSHPSRMGFRQVADTAALKGMLEKVPTVRIHLAPPDSLNCRENE
jgi:hypothetical protein